MSSEDRQQASSIFRPDRGNIIAAALMAAISLIIIPWAPLYLVWVLIIPILLVYWSLRARTTVDDDGITVTYAFRGAQSATWDEIEGIGFKGARTFLHTTSGTNFHMPGVTFNSLPRLDEASRGRIPDAITAASEYADGKMEVIDRDGNKVLLTQEEYRQHLAEQEARKNRPNEAPGVGAGAGTGTDADSTSQSSQTQSPSQHESESKE